MKIFLIFPHLVLINAQTPHLAIPLLASYLRRHTKHEVMEIDFNIKIINGLLKAFSFANPGFFLESFLSRHRILFNSQDSIEKLVRMSLTQYLKSNSMSSADSSSMTEGYWQVANEDMVNTLQGKRVDPLLKLLGTDYFENYFKNDSCIVGLSISYFTQFLPALSIAKAIKAINFKVHIVFGGNTIRLIEHKILKTPSLFSVVDSFIVDEGEESIVKLADVIETKGQISKVPNLIHINGNKIEKNIESPFDIRNAQSPDFRIIKNHNYLFPRSPRRLTLSLRTAVGCYWNKCSFCTLSLRKYQQRSIDQVLDDISFVVRKYRPSTVRITDLSVSTNRLLQIAEGVIRRRLRVRWEAFARLDKSYTSSICAKLSRSGCAALMLGLESGNQRVEDIMNKGQDLKEIPLILENLHRAGIYTSLGVIVGFPSETEGELMETINFLKTNSRNISNIGMSPFGLNFHSGVYNNPAKYGVKKIEEPEGLFFTRNFPYEVNSGITGWQARQHAAQFRLSKRDRFYEKATRLIFKKVSERRIA